MLAFNFQCAVVVAEVNHDFGYVFQDVTFFPNETLRTKKCVTVQTFEDQVYEGVEQYGLHFYRLGKDFTEQNSPARLYIEDNDGKRRGREVERGRGEREGGREREREREGERGGEGEREGREVLFVPTQTRHNIMINI